MTQTDPSSQPSTTIVVATLLTVGLLEMVVGLTLLLPSLWMTLSTTSDKYITHTPSQGYFDFSEITIVVGATFAAAQLAFTLGGAAVFLTGGLVARYPRLQVTGALSCVAIPIGVGVCSFILPFVIAYVQDDRYIKAVDFSAGLGGLAAAYSIIPTLIGVVMAALVFWSQRRRLVHLDAPLPD